MLLKRYISRLTFSQIKGPIVDVMGFSLLAINSLFTRYIGNFQKSFRVLPSTTSIVSIVSILVSIVALIVSLLWLIG